jgi:hypothetical protein
VAIAETGWRGEIRISVSTTQRLMLLPSWCAGWLIVAKFYTSAMKPD